MATTVNDLETMLTSEISDIAMEYGANTSLDQNDQDAIGLRIWNVCKTWSPNLPPPPTE